MNGQTVKQSPQNSARFLRWEEWLQKLFFGRFPGFPKEGTKRSALLQFVWEEGMLFLFAAFLTAKMAPFGTRPFGPPLLLCSGTHLCAVAAGCLLGALVTKEWMLLLFLVLSLMLKVLLLRFDTAKSRNAAPSLFSPLLAATASAVMALFLGIYGTAKEGFSFHGLFALLFHLAISLLLAIVFYGKFEQTNGDGQVRVLTLLGDAALSFCGVYAVSSLSLFSLPLSGGIGIFLILYFTGEQKKDLLSVAVISLCAGLGGGISLLPSLAAAGIVAYITRRFGQKFYPSLTLLSAALLSFYAEGYQTLGGTLPSLLVGTALFYLYRKLPFSKDFAEQETEEENRDPFDGREFSNDGETATKDVATAIRGLSDLLSGLSKRMRKPDFTELQALCDSVFEEICESCSYCAGCRTEHVLDLSDVKNKAASALSRKGRLDEGDLPPYFRSRCGANTEKLLQECNLRYMEKLRVLSETDGASSFAACYRSAARLLSEGSEARLSEGRPDRELSRKAAKTAKDLQITCEAIVVRGKSRKTLTMYGVDPGSIGVSAAKIQQQFGTLCETRFSVPSIRMEPKGGILEMESRPRLSFEVAYASKAKTGETLCGDECCSFTDKSGNFYALLSDGMGSGKEAATAAGICTAFTKQLSDCGGSLGGIVESINAFLLQQKEECSATVDLLRADPYTGKAVFVKSGAVPSLLLRDGSILKISSVSMPLGITKEINTEQIPLELHPGDLILLTSDGVMPDFERSIWLCKLLTMAGDAKPALLCDTILDRASRISSRPDDASVCVIRVKAAD